ncbi:MAG: hypothetical protein NVS1B9_13830 [Solirubrobacteraceae bacterium]
MCAVRLPLAEVLARLGTDPQRVPRCDCGRPLKPDVILFGECLAAEALLQARRLAAEADLMICIGSSLEVWPVGELPALTLAAGGQVLLVTQGPTSYDEQACMKLDGDVVAELEAVLAHCMP